MSTRLLRKWIVSHGPAGVAHESIWHLHERKDTVTSHRNQKYLWTYNFLVSSP